MVLGPCRSIATHTVIAYFQNKSPHSHVLAVNEALIRKLTSFAVAAAA